MVLVFVFAQVSFIVFLLPGFVQSCGLITHAEIAYRAIHLFKTTEKLNFQQLLIKHSDAFQAGAPYPDAFYSSFCAGGIYHNISEDTHFAPFINATVNYIKNHYSQPWNKNAEKLVAFLFGITSHQVADILWHSLGIDQGFLETMAAVNFHGTFSAAHTWGDIGGDVMNAYEQNISYISAWSNPHLWYIPTKDLFNIYLEFYGWEKISETVILDCFKELYLERIAELLAASKLYGILAHKSPFLVQRLDDFFLGGMDDMAGWTQVIWQSVAQMLLNDTRLCHIPYNTLCLQCTTKKHPNKNINCSMSSTGTDNIYTSKTPPSFTIAREISASHLGLTHSDIIIQKTPEGVFMKPSSKLKKKLENAKSVVPYESKMASMYAHSSVSQEKPHSLYTVDNPYSKFGWSLTTGDVDGDGYEDLVIGAPGYGFEGSPQQGCVFIVYGNATETPKGNVNLNSSEAFSCGRSKNQSRFGHSIVLLDLNSDGIKDIVVGAPSSNNFPSLEYQGEVLIFYGKKLERRTLRNVDLVIKCSMHRYCNLGWGLTTADINGDSQDDLLISTPFFAASGPQRGCVGSLFAQPHLKTSKIIEFEQLNWIQCGKQDFAWFGYSMDVSKGHNFHNTSGKLLAIGEPMYRICELSNCSFSPKDQQGVGRVHLYFLGVSQKPIYLTNIPGPKNILSQFGSALAFGKPFNSTTLVLAVSATSNDVKSREKLFPVKFYQAGTVYLINVSTFGQSDLLTTFSGDRFFDSFGSEIQFSDVNQDEVDDLIIASPFRKKHILGTSGGVESGQVYIFFGGHNFPLGNATSQCLHSKIVPCPGEKASLQFSGNEDKSRFGSSFTLHKTVKNVFLVVSSPHSSRGDRLSGLVSLYLMPYQ